MPSKNVDHTNTENVSHLGVITKTEWKNASILQWRKYYTFHVLDDIWDSRNGTVVRALASHQCDPGSNLGPASYVGWVCCWLSFLLRGFFSGYSGFPSSTKTNISKFQYIQSGNSGREERLCGFSLKFPFILFYFMMLVDNRNNT